MAFCVMACDIYPHEGHPNKLYGLRLKALVLLLRYSGLRIADAVTLSRNQVEDGILKLRTAKTGMDVRVPLPPVAIAALDAIGMSNYYFGQARPRKNPASATISARSKNSTNLQRWKTGTRTAGETPFRWNSWWLVPRSSKSPFLLGHESVKVTQKHYAAWVRARQEQLETTVRKTFDSYANRTVRN
jgi:integrase/recombinase XerD